MRDSGFLENVPLRQYTSLALGGPARFFIECSTVTQIHDALQQARERSLRVHILGGGSNVIFADNGFDGLILRVNLRGIEHGSGGAISVAAGEPWDALVETAIRHDLAGIECLSGIPGLTGGTPIQNVGAYGQEVRETIVAVHTIDRRTLVVVTFTNPECGFGYRTSRFKTVDAGRYIVTGVEFKLKEHGKPSVRYPDLERHLQTTGLEPTLSVVRDAVIAIRKKKSMVLDPADPHSRSVGSFFTNPVVTTGVFNEVQRRWESLEGTGSIPSYPSNGMIKIPAVWLVEHSGFVKGLRRGGVGISAHHSLALVNYGGSTADLLSLANDIRQTVHSKFGVHLDIEPIVV